MRRARGAHDVVDARRVEATLGEHAHARVEQPAHRLAALRAQLARLRAGVPVVASIVAAAATMIVVPRRCVPFAHERPRFPPPSPKRLAGSAIVPPTSPQPAGASPTPTSIAISDEVAVGLGPARRRRGRRRRARPAARSRVPARVLRGREARRDHRGRQRSAVGTRTRRGPRPRGPEARDRHARGRRHSTTCSPSTASTTGRRDRATARRRPRPTGRDHLHVGHDRHCRRARCTATGSSRSSRRPTSATRGTAAAARSPARRSRTSAS